MAKFKDDGEHSSPGSSAHAVEITAAKYLGKDGKQSYDNPTDFLAFGKKLSDSDVEGLRKGVKYLKEGFKTDGGSDIRTDVAGKQYRFYTFLLPKSRPGAKIVVSVPLIRLFDDYQNGRITVNFTLDELIDEARKEQTKQ